MIDEADRDGDGEVNEEEFFRCLLCLALRPWATATCAQLFDVHCMECHVLLLSKAICSLLSGHIAKSFCVIADIAGIFAVGS